MAFRYCRDGERWLETSEYTVDDTGETVCPVDDHGHVCGYLDGGMDTDRDLERSLRRTYSDDSLIRKMVGAAKRQDLVTVANQSSDSTSLGARFGI